MSKDRTNPTPLYFWSVFLLYPAGCRLHGALAEDQEATKKQTLFTSLAVGRDGLVVVTESGSYYHLATPHELCSTPTMRNACYRNLALSDDHTIEEFIDACIAYRAAEPKSKKSSKNDNSENGLSLR